MNLKEMFDAETIDEGQSSTYEPSDIGIRSFKSKGSKKLRFMRAYSDEGELIFDPFDPKSRNNENKPVNYNKKFSKEMKQHHKLIRQQAQYVAELEKLFRATTGFGTANPRQLTKTDVELANVLSQARGQLLQMINGVSSLKKTIADLQLKQYAKLATGGDEATPNLMTPDLRGSSMLREILNEDMSALSSMNAAGDANLPDLESIDRDDSLVGVDVKHENRDVKLAIIYDTDTSKTTPIAMDMATGETLTDYNIPTYMNDVDVLLTEGVAKDKLGHTFPMIFK